MASTIADSAVLSDLLTGALSPINNYSQGLLQMALARRQRDQQLADEARRRGEQVSDVATERAYQTQRDTIRYGREKEMAAQQQGFEERLRKSAQEAAMAQIRAQWQHATEEEQKATLQNLRVRATALKLPLPDSNLDYQSQFDQLTSDISAAKSASVLELAKAMGNASRRIATLAEVPEEQVARAQVDRFLGDPLGSAGLTPQEKQKLLADPKAMPSIINRLAGDRSKKGRATFDEVMASWSKAAADANDILTKRAGNRVEAEAAKGESTRLNLLLGNLLKDGDLPTEAYTAMFPAVVNEADKIQQERTPKLPPLPPPVQPQVQPLQTSTLAPMTQAITNIPIAGQQPATFQNLFPEVSNQMPRAMVPGSTANPQLERFLIDQAIKRQGIAPTAFPVGPP